METKYRQLSDLNLIENFLFTAVMDHEEYGPRMAQIMLETILARKVNVKIVSAEKTVLPLEPRLHGIRMDAVVEESDVEVSPGNVFDLEPDRRKSEKALLPKRARYYHSVMDSRKLEAGAVYDRLPGVWVIFITSYDPFGEDHMVYTIKSHCVELPEMEYEDGATTLFLYIHGTKGIPSDELKDLLCFMGSTTPENAKSPELTEIQSFVDNIKMNPELKEAYMTWDDYIRSERREAVAEVTEEAERRIAEAKHEAAEAERRAEETVAEVTEEANRRIAESKHQAAEAKHEAAEAERRAEEAERKAAILTEQLKALQMANRN